jgi:holo-[acyl-carrier protein] synthase
MLPLFYFCINLLIIGADILISGIGVDIIEIKRIKNAVEKNPDFINKIFSCEEIEYFKSKNMRPEFIAGKFAAKEAVAKAMGTGFSGFDIKDIVIIKLTSGKPEVKLIGKAKEIVQQIGKYRFHLSISHSNENAVAYAVLEVEDK